MEHGAWSVGQRAGRKKLLKLQVLDLLIKLANYMDL
jgi:hypothetical protein